jgi:hypothetical protein
MEPRYTYVDNFNVKPREKDCEFVPWIHVTRDTAQWRASAFENIVSTFHETPQFLDYLIDLRVSGEICLWNQFSKLLLIVIGPIFMVIFSSW